MSKYSQSKHLCSKSIFFDWKFHLNIFCFSLKILPDVPKSRQEVLMHKKGSQNCEFIVQIIDIYVNTFPHRFFFEKKTKIKFQANICNRKKSLLIVMEW